MGSKASVPELKPGETSADNKFRMTKAGVMLKNLNDCGSGDKDSCAGCYFDYRAVINCHDCADRTRWVKVESKPKPGVLKPGEMDNKRNFYKDEKGVLYKNTRGYDSLLGKGCRLCAFYNTNCDEVIGSCRTGELWVKVETKKEKVMNNKPSKTPETTETTEIPVLKRGQVSDDGMYRKTNSGVLLKNMKDWDVGAIGDDSHTCNACYGNHLQTKNSICTGCGVTKNRWVKVAKPKAKPKSSIKVVPYEPTPTLKKYPCSKTSITTSIGSTVNLVYFPETDDGRPKQLKVELLGAPENGSRTAIEFGLSMEGLGALFMGCLSLGAVPIEPPIQKPATGVK